MPKPPKKTLLRVLLVGGALILLAKIYPMLALISVNTIVTIGLFALLGYTVERATPVGAELELSSKKTRATKPNEQETS